MDPLLVIIAAIALIAIGAAGWLLGKQSAAKAEALADNLRLQLDGVREERDRALEDFKQASLERERLRAEASHFDARMKDLVESKEKQLHQFREAADQLLEKAQKEFLEKAGARFSEADKESKANLEKLLQPMAETLGRYEKGLKEFDEKREGSFGALKQAVSKLSEDNERVRREAQRLANVMVSSPKARGRWGEEQLKTILESAGLSENIDFFLQQTVHDGEKHLRPDCIIKLPGGRSIVIDVKCPLVAFEQAYEEEDEARRADLLRQHADALKSYANDLGRKGYWSQFDQSPDFVVMFVPGEHFLSAAAERAPDLIETAFRNGVIVTSTINMLALAKIMAGMWRQEALTAKAKEIAELGQELHKRLATMAGHVARMGKNLSGATDAYNKMIGSLDSNVLTQAKRFEELGAASPNEIEDLKPVDSLPRQSAKLVPPKKGANDGEDAA